MPENQEEMSTESPQDTTPPDDAQRRLIRALSHGNPRLVIVGGGYVGLPMAVVAAEAHCDVTILELDASKVERINAGESYIRDIDGATLRELVEAGRISATTDPGAAYAGAQAALICVPTPLNKTQDPDVSFVLDAITAMAPHVEAPMLLSLESTVYPGFTREVLVPTLEREGLRPGRDVFVAFSPERVDPGNATWQTKNTPKVVGGLTPACNEVALALYRRLVDEVVPVSSTDAAEMVKILENTFRAVNIALVNEVAIMSHRLGIDAWEVIDAASTKPFGYMPFYPGPGIGGHCIPVDPFYLSWKLRTLRYHARFIELAGQVNSAMPEVVVDRLADELNERRQSVKGAKILIVGVAYKPDIDDLRESPALDVIELLRRRGAEVSYVDPHVPNVALAEETLQALPVDVDPASFDAAVIVTHHRRYDYERLVASCPLILDTRNITRALTPGEGVRLVRL
jgi:UDP-N-acetyl-D-glucosamine dehydrogenase